MLLKNIFVCPKYPESLKKLFYLAYNLWALWDEEAIKIFNRIDPALFRLLKENPVKFLHSIPEDRIIELSEDDAFIYSLAKVWKKYRGYSEKHTEYREMFKNRVIVYFSMEYGLHSSIPIYAGGLGILSGDHLKGASDLGIPLIGVGLFYKYGYFRQSIDINGVQGEDYTENNVYYMPVKELTTPDSESIFVIVNILKVPVKVKVWIVNIGSVRLLLLDTNIDENPPEFRIITDYLYDARRDVRFMQEMLLGFGGMKALEAIHVKPDVYHLNEGHSAFLIIERLRNFIQYEKCSFDEAYALIKNTTVFTTHTPVEAGNENYPSDMVEKYLKNKVDSLKIPMEQFIKFGVLHDANTFWLPAFAIRFAKFINGVSQIYSEVSKKMWMDLFPHRINCEIPIIHITNGVHHSWLSRYMRALFDRYLGPDYLLTEKNDELCSRIFDIPDEEIWDSHVKRKRDMIAYLRRLVEEQYTEKGYSHVKIRKVQEMLNTKYLTIGFARRFTAYKRPTLILKDKERLKVILSHIEKPVQLIFAGKAHPADTDGKNMIKEIVDFAKEFEVEDRVIFIENYNRSIAEYLVQGVDVWLNTPVKPFEASGTSGMKAGINGVLNLSIMDGWWPECYNSKNGWGITSGGFHGNAELRDLSEANHIYDLLEEEITHLFYERNEREVPEQWVKLMKESIYTVMKDFTISRMLMEYSKKSYMPAIQSREKLIENDKEMLKQIQLEAKKVRTFWDKIYIKDVFMDVDKKEILFSDDTLHIECYVYLDDAPHENFKAELFYFMEKEDTYETEALRFVEKYSDKIAKYEGDVRLKSSGVQSVGVRLVPSDDEIRILYPSLIKWKE